MINFILEVNYPNPFNMVTQIKYTLLKRSLVKIDIHDINEKNIQSHLIKN